MRAEHLFEDSPVTGRLPEGEIGAIRSDSRRAVPGCLFVCLKGAKRDGHDCAAQALENGAAAVLGEHPVPGVKEENMLLTPDTRAAESALWNNLTGRPADGRMKIAVTGTAGKTTVTLLLSELLRASGRRTGYVTTVGAAAGDTPVGLGENGGSSVSDIPGAMTTPDPEFFFPALQAMRDAGCDTVLYEASSQSLALKKTAALTPDLAVFTNLFPEHMDFHGTMEEYFRAKASLLRGVPRAVIWGDDPWLARLPELWTNTAFTVCSAESGRTERADVTALRIRSRGADGMEYLWFSSRAVFRVRTPMPGRFSVVNTMLACAAALIAGGDPAAVRDAVNDFRGAPGRLYRVGDGTGRGKRLPAVFIDYAHTPEAMEAVLRTVRSFSPGRLTVVFGCGGERDRTKRPRMARAAERGADEVIVSSDNPRGEDPDAIFRDILSGFGGSGPAAVIPDRERAIRYAFSSAPPDGTVLLLGKGH
ncbi:MAG: UDP-N-acetylmuramoyl-L-alanyl-D-glutamate--2,6-diaminopimelate ligase [Clostridia bacterium]|nr:UDP-N-acetylmuramoyl-L-alanyl-D-glutamate--2,6-diaminopimelate ligase [Clostridia bacterium]